MNRQNVLIAAAVSLAMLWPTACIQPYTVAPADPVPPPTDIDLDQVLFLSDWTRGGSVRLTNGEYREPAAPGSSAELVIQATGDIARGELNGKPSAAVLLVTNAGGSGSFFDLALLRWQAGRWVNTDTAELGDRVQAHALTIEDDAIRIDLTTHGPGDPMCCPSLRVKRLFTVQDDRLAEKNAAARPAALAAAVGPVWKWKFSRYSNDTQSVPPDPDHYTLQLLPEGNVSVRADCNRAGGVYRIEDHQITMDITHSTMAACPPDSLEQDFIKDLNAAAIYFIRDGTLFIDLKYDSGTMEFLP
jgi:heat shock protein HslJ